MSYQLSHILQQWYERRHQSKWALGIIYQIEGHSYRKPGAMILVNEQGEQFGLLSGGCLEADIKLNALKSIAFNKSIAKSYDSRDDDDFAYHLGCGGIVHVLLQPLTPQNNFLHLETFHNALKNREKGTYSLRIPHQSLACKGKVTIDEHYDARFGAPASLQEIAGESWLTLPILPPPHLFIAGGGVDAVPVCELAKKMGWKVSIWDNRPSHANKTLFSKADAVLHCSEQDLQDYLLASDVFMAVVMTHNLKMDADIVTRLNTCSLNYVALLGPKVRKQEVLQHAELNQDALSFHLSSPAGIDIGGELPESIALSIISGCHMAVYGKLSG